MILPMSHAEFLDDLGQRAYRYLIEAADPATGLVADRGRTDGSAFSHYASSAACGFARQPSPAFGECCKA